MRKTLVVIVLIWSYSACFTQPLYAYWDQFNNHFNIYDDGVLKTLETIPVKSFKTGNSVCAYVTDINDFKIYYNGKSNLVSKFLPKNYVCSDALVAWSSGVASYVFYNGNVTKICDQCSDFNLNDSVVTFTDRFGYFNVFYKNKIRSLEISPRANVNLGRNLVAFIDRNDQLKVFYHDTIIGLEYFSDSLRYACGLNTVSYIDRQNRLRVCYKKQVFTLDKLRPKTWATGDDMVAWVDQNNNFRVFHKGNLFLLENYEPGVFNIIEGVLYYKSNQNEMKVFENGKGKVIENYYPTQIAGRNNTLVYNDFRNRLKAYNNGQVYSVSDDIVTSFKVFPNLVVFYSNAKTMTFWKDGDKIEVQLN